VNERVLKNLKPVGESVRRRDESWCCVHGMIRRFDYVAHNASGKSFYGAKSTNCHWFTLLRFLSIELIPRMETKRKRIKVRIQKFVHIIERNSARESSPAALASAKNRNGVSTFVGIVSLFCHRERGSSLTDCLILRSAEGRKCKIQQTGPSVYVCLRILENVPFSHLSLSFSLFVILGALWDSSKLRWNRKCFARFSPLVPSSSLQLIIRATN